MRLSCVPMQVGAKSWLCLTTYPMPSTPWPSPSATNLRMCGSKDIWSRCSHCCQRAITWVAKTWPWCDISNRQLGLKKVRPLHHVKILIGTNRDSRRFKNRRIKISHFKTRVLELMSPSFIKNLLILNIMKVPKHNANRPSYYTIYKCTATIFSQPNKYKTQRTRAAHFKKMTFWQGPNIQFANTTAQCIVITTQEVLQIRELEALKTKDTTNVYS